MAIKLHHGLMLLGLLLVAYGVLDAWLLPPGPGTGIIVGIVGIGFVVIGWLMMRNAGPLRPSRVYRDNLNAVRTERRD